MPKFLFLVSVLVSFSTVAKADFIRCTPDERTQIESAIVNAFDAISAATVQITPESGSYQSWFGMWDKARVKEVRRTLSALKNHIRTSKVTFFCAQTGEQNCDPGVYANVFPNDPSTVYVCPPYFDLPTLDGSTFLEVHENGTRAGTIIHEMTHFNVVGGTSDFFYSRQLCISSARTLPNQAVRNADSFQYFTEDAYLKQR